MKLFECINGLYTKDPKIYDACRRNKFEFNGVVLIGCLAKDFDNIPSIRLLGNSYMYMDTRDLVAVLWLLIPQKSKAPYFANMAKPLADALKEDYYAKCRQVLGWSSKDLEHCEEIINYFFTNNKDYFNDV